MYDNIDVHIKSFISEFPGYGLKYISKLQSHCANMTFSEKSGYNIFLQQVTDKVGESAMSYIKRLHNGQAWSVLLGNS